MIDSLLDNRVKSIKRDIVFKKKDGKECYLEFYMQNFLDDPAIEGIVINFRDVTDRVKAERKIIHLSTHDPLTGLPNKINFDNRIDMLLKSAKANDTGFAILMLDIDSLMYIKNTLGYKLTEEYLAQIAIKLKLYCDSTKFICRYSANRFIIIFEGTHTIDEYETFIKGIYALFSTPLKVDKFELYVDISIGISFFSKDDESREQLIRNAEAAIYLAKNKGKNKYKYYSSDIDIQSYKHFILRKDLRRAIENDQLKLYYQPVVNLGTNEIIAAEVLLRWEHPEWGILSPVEFIPIAEETGCIIKIGKWLVREVANSSLTNLSALNIDILRIDGSLVKNINKDETSTVITRYIIKMAQELKIKLIAERVDTWDQLSFLRDLKCYSGQGQIYSEPVPPEDFESILAKKKCKPIIVSDFTVHEDRRKYFRIKFTQPLEANLSILEIKGKKVNVGNTKVLIKNIGPGGLCFISNIRLPVDEQIILQFKTYLIGEEIRVYGCTVWTGEMEDNLFEYGVKFTFDENKRTDLIRVLNQVQVKMRNDVLFADGSFISGSGSPHVYFETQ